MTHNGPVWSHNADDGFPFESGSSKAAYSLRHLRQLPLPHSLGTEI